MENNTKGKCNIKKRKMENKTKGKWKIKQMENGR